MTMNHIGRTDPPDPAKARTLAAALPWLMAYHGQTIVVKYGGNAMTDDAIKVAFAEDIAFLRFAGFKPVVVHGGGPQISRMLDRLERKGLVARSRSEQDRRMIELTLTERGAEAARALPSLIANALNAQLEGFSADELVTLTGLLQRFIANGPGATGCPKPDEEADS